MKGKIKIPHHWPFVREIHRPPVDSPHKGLVIRKACSCHDVIMGVIYLHALYICLLRIGPHTEPALNHDDVIKWKHFSTLLAICAGNLPVPGEFPAQKPVTRSFAVFFHLCPNKRLSKKSWGWWFETPSCPLWRHCNAYEYFLIVWFFTTRYLDFQNVETLKLCFLKCLKFFHFDLEHAFWLIYNMCITLGVLGIVFPTQFYLWI